MSTLNELQKLSVSYTALLRQLAFTQRQLMRLKYKHEALAHNFQKGFSYGKASRVKEAITDLEANLQHLLECVQDQSATHRANLKEILIAEGNYHDPKKKHYEKRKAIAAAARERRNACKVKTFQPSTDSATDQDSEIQQRNIPLIRNKRSGPTIT